MRTEPPEAFSRPVIGDRPEYDPLQLCIYSTVALISWLITPALTAALFATTGVAAYFRARRLGLVKSKCKLGDTRLVITYLGLLAAAGWIATGWALFG